MDTVVERGSKKRTPRVDTRSSLGVENKPADAGQDDRVCNARPNSQARTETTKTSYHKQYWQPYTDDAQSAGRDG